MNTMKMISNYMVLNDMKEKSIIKTKIINAIKNILMKNQDNNYVTILLININKSD